MAEVGRARADGVGLREVELEPALVRDGGQVQHRVRGAAERHVDGERVLERLLRHDVARTDVVPHELHHRKAGLLGEAVARGHDGGNRAVPHGHHLRESAGLRPGRHQEYVRSGVNFLRHVFVERYYRPDSAAVNVLHVPEEIFMLGVSRSENDKLNVVAHNSVKRTAHNIEALMRNKSRYHCDHGNGRRNRKIQNTLQSHFIFRFI